MYTAAVFRMRARIPQPLERIGDFDIADGQREHRHWLPDREIALLGDSSSAVLDLLTALIRHGVISVTRLRLDAALYGPAPPRQPGTTGRMRQGPIRLPGHRNGGATARAKRPTGPEH